MNCKHVQELLPLYVGRDLEEKHMKLVTAHVECCAECAGSADEFRRTQQLLHLFAPPTFSEAVYSGIRQRVLREIGTESTAQTVPQLVASLFRPRPRWAVVTALLLAVSVFAFYFIASRKTDRQLAGGKPTVETTQDQQTSSPSAANESAAAPSPSSKENYGPSPLSTGENSGGRSIAVSVNPAVQSQRRRSSGAVADRTGSGGVNTPDAPSMAASASQLDNNLAKPDTSSARDPLTPEKTLRVEMQTKDRNIRIIWFSHQPTKQDFPNKSSEGI